MALAESSREVLAEGADFYASPTLSADGQRLAWVEWDRPAQPWTVTRLLCRERDANGDWGVAHCIAAEDESLQQPRFDTEGRLYCLSDRNGFWQPWGEFDDLWQALPAEPADHAAAPWQLGASTWMPISPQHYLATWFEGGSGNWDCTMKMAACNASPAPTPGSATWPWMPGTSMPSRPHQSARRQ